MQLSIRKALPPLTSLILALATTIPTWAAELPSQASLDRVMDAAMAQSDLPAMVAIAVTREGERRSYSHGPAIWTKTAPVTTEHLFRIASMTKLLTSIAALQLVEQGLVGLDEDLSDLLPDMAEIPLLRDGELIPATQPITLRHLLSHSSGFGYEGFTVTGEWEGKGEAKWAYDEAPRRFEAGEGFLYGTSSDWAGRLVERLSGQSLETYFREHITGPLAMTRTAYVVPEDLHPMIVSGGTRGPDGEGPLVETPDRVPATPATQFSGGGGLFSTPSDFTKLLRSLLNGGAYDGGRVLEATTVAMLRENQVPEGSMDPSGGFYVPSFCCNFNGLMDADSGWGLATMLDNNTASFARNRGVLQWGGAYNTYFFIDLEAGIAASIYTQHLPFNHSQSTKLWDRFASLLYGESGTE